MLAYGNVKSLWYLIVSGSCRGALDQHGKVYNDGAVMRSVVWSVTPRHPFTTIYHHWTLVTFLWGQSGSNVSSNDLLNTFIRFHIQ